MVQAPDNGLLELFQVIPENLPLYAHRRSGWRTTLTCMEFLVSAFIGKLFFIDSAFRIKVH
jgi:hypothetical protein